MIVVERFSRCVLSTLMLVSTPTYSDNHRNTHRHILVVTKTHKQRHTDRHSDKDTHTHTLTETHTRSDRDSHAL